MLEILLNVIRFILILSYGITVTHAGYIGIDFHFGIIWAIVAIALMLVGFIFPIIIGAFFGATDVWGWHWSSALLLYLPFLIILIPLVIIAIISAIKRN